MSLNVQGINPFLQNGAKVDGIGAVNGRSAGGVTGGSQREEQGGLMNRLAGINGELTPHVDKPGLRTLGFA